MKYSSRFFLWAPIALLLALALGVSARWWSEANDLSKELDALNGHEAMPGVTIHFGTKNISGYPFNVDTVFKDFTLTVKGPHGPLTWRAENFASHALTFGHPQWIFEAAGKQKLLWTNKKGQKRGLEFGSGSLHASAVLKDGSLDRFDLDLIGFDSAALNIARTQFHARRNPTNDQIDVVIDIDEAHLSPRLQGLCGETIDRLKLDGDLSNGKAFAKALTGAAAWQSGFDAWQKAGGRFFLAQSELACGKANVFAQGQLALDASKRPHGLLTAQIAGFDGLAMQHGQQHGQQPGTFASALLSQPRDPNPAKEGRVTVRAAFRDGATYLGDTPAGMNNPLY